MGIAAKAMIVVFVVFTVLNVDFANGIYSAVRGWIEADTQLVLYQRRADSAVRLLLT